MSLVGLASALDMGFFLAWPNAWSFWSTPADVSVHYLRGQVCIQAALK